MLSPEQRRLEELRERIDHLSIRAEDVARVLPEALAGRGRCDEALAEALAPHVEAALAAWFRRSPHFIAAAVAAAFPRAVQRWARDTLGFHARRHSGVKRNVRYAVDHVLLLHRGTGALLQHVTGDAAAARHSDIRGLATALRANAAPASLLADCLGFEARATDDRLVWIVHGPRTALAAVIRGTPPDDLRSLLQRSLLRLETEHTDALASFSGGDCTPFETLQPLLESCLLSEPHTASRRPVFVGLSAAALALIAGLGIWTWHSHEADRRWNEVLGLLRSEPGLVVTSTANDGARYRISGFRDPLSRDPTVLLTEAGYTADQVVAHWSPYYSLDPQLVIQRATSMLQPPDRVSLALDGSTLVISGSVDKDWARDASRLAVFIPGVTAVRTAGLKIVSAADLIRTIQSLSIPFATGSSQITPADQPKVDALIALLRDLDGIALRTGKRVLLEVIGAGDESGPEAMGFHLGTARAHAVLTALGGKTFGQSTQLTTGVEAPFPSRTRREARGFSRASFTVKLTRAD